MVSAKEKEIIINAIKVLRSRRVRPSQRKISWYVRREHLLPETTTDAVLDQLVESEEVLRVSYKGATSYRVAANWSKAALVRRRPTRTKVNVMNSEATCATLRAAVSAACGPYGGGATKDNIEVHLRTAGHDRLLDKLDVLLHREMRSGSLLRVVTTHRNNEVVTFILPPTSGPIPTMPLPLTNATPESPAPSPPNVDDAAAALGKWRCTIGEDQHDIYGDGGPMEEDTSSPMMSDNHQQEPTHTTIGLATHGRGSNVNQGAISYDRRGLESLNTSIEPNTVGSRGGEALLSAGSVVCSRGSAAVSSAVAASEAPSLVVRGKELYHRDQDLTSHLLSQHQHQHLTDVVRQPDNHSAMPRQPSKRNKRAKKVFDPSELQGLLMNQAGGGMHVPLSSIAHTIPVPLTAGAMLPQRKVKPQPNRCDVCTFTVNHLNMHEDLLICHNCSARAHPSCLGYSAELAIRSHLAPWTCMDCKHCAICNMDHNIGTLIFCDECDQAYHLTCHQPPLSEQPQGSWICFNCIPQSNKNGYECVAGLPTPRDSPVPDDESRGSTGGPWDSQIIDSEIPNATHWSIDQVVQWFDEKGFEDNAQVFRQQDIDGTALLMLTRNDVLCGLQMKLGPALKVYKHVRILQTRLHNPPLP